MQTLDQSKSYYRRINYLDVVTLLLIIGLLFLPQGFLLSILLIVVYPFSHSKILVSAVDNKQSKFWVRKMDWDGYLKKHGINRLMQFSSHTNDVHVKQA